MAAIGVLLDTCVLIDVLRGAEDAHRFLNFLRAVPAISAVSVAELFAGVKDRREENAVEAILAVSRVVAVNAAIARAAGQHLRHYAASHGLDVIDAIIAATAEQTGARLATLNLRHFPMFPRLKRAY